MDSINVTFFMKFSTLIPQSPSLLAFLSLMDWGSFLQYCQKHISIKTQNKLDSRNYFLMHARKLYETNRFVLHNSCFWY